MTSPLTSSEFDEIINGMEMPAGFARGRRPQRDPSTLVTSWGELDASHVAAAQTHIDSGASLGIRPPDVKALRHTHHRLAQLLASGMDETIAGKLCNYSVSRVSILKGDPAFGQLLAHYASVVDDEFVEFQTAAAALSLDMLQALQAMLDESPEKFGPGHLMDAIKLLADRTGHAPVTKTQNVNINVDLGSRLAEARKRANATLIEGTSTVVVPQ